MRMTRGKGIRLALMLALLAPAAAQDDVVFKAMKDEMARSMTQLHFDKTEKPYFIAYRADDVNMAAVSATLGSLTGTNPDRRRVLSVELRVGDYAVDSSNFLSMRMFGGGMGGMFSGLTSGTLDDDYMELRRELWLTTDAQYKKAVEDLSAKRAVLEANKRETEIPDFSKEKPFQSQQPRTEMKVETAALEQMAREVSLAFKGMADLLTSSVQVEARSTYTRYLNSEGSSFTRSDPRLHLSISASTQAVDGQPLDDSIDFYGKSMADLPSTSELAARARGLGERLEKLREAKAVDHYNGPVLFEEGAGAELFAQTFATGLSSARTPVSEDPRFEMVMTKMFSTMSGGANFQDKIGGRVLPEYVSVTDKPGMTEYKGIRLMGTSTVDDDCVPARDTKLVENGMLVTLLASRVPVDAVRNSTGSRHGFGPSPSNLIFSASKSSSAAELRSELLRRAQARGLHYGIVVRRLGGNGANTLMRMATRMAGAPGGGGSAAMAEAFKLFPDGHEEPLRGAELSDFTASLFRDIVAVGNEPAVYDEQFMPQVSSIFSMGMGGAGADLPVASFVAPSLLFEEVTLTKTAGPFPNPPMSKAPLAEP